MHLNGEISRSGEEEKVPEIWREIYNRIVDEFCRGNYLLAGVDCVEPLSESTAYSIRSVLDDHGVVLSRLPEESWATSICRWMDDHWYVIVDLFAEPAQITDLVITSRVFQQEHSYHVVVDSVAVP